MLQRDGHPTALGEAINTYGRIHKSLHMLALIDDEGLRRGIKGIRNLQEGRHALAERVFHGRKSHLFQRYYGTPLPIKTRTDHRRPKIPVELAR